MFIAATTSGDALEPVVSRAKAQGDFAGDLQEEKWHRKADVVWRTAGAELNDRCEAGGTDCAVEEGGDVDGEGADGGRRSLHVLGFGKRAGARGC